MPIFEMFEIPMARLIPRQSVTVEPTWFQRACASWETTTTDLLNMSVPAQQLFQTTPCARISAKHSPTVIHSCNNACIPLSKKYYTPSITSTPACNASNANKPNAPASAASNNGSNPKASPRPRHEFLPSHLQLRPRIHPTTHQRY